MEGLNALKEIYSFLLQNDSLKRRQYFKQKTLPRFFSTFDKDQLANIHRYYWKEHLKITKLAKFESDMYVRSERRYIAQQSR